MSTRLQGKKVLIITANTGIERDELLKPLKALKDMGASVTHASIKGGETRVFEADGPRGLRFTMTEPWTLLLLDDARVIHESTPIQPLGEHGYRDTLVLTWRAGAFQGEGV